MSTALPFDPVYDSQRLFRELLQTMARPGEIREFRLDPGALPDGLSRGQLLVAMTLLNYDSPFWMAEEDDAAAGFVAFHTGAPRVGRDAADYYFPRIPALLDLVPELPTGDPAYPETGPTLVVRVERLASEYAGDGALVLTGPGIDGKRIVEIAGIPPALWELRASANEEFPCGIDFIFCADQAEGARFLSLPRTTFAHVNLNPS